MFSLKPDHLKQIKLFLFDFDGVFTSGRKGENFNERDSMGINMLRFGYYLLFKRIPKIGIATGEENKIVKDFAKREHTNYIFLGGKNKKDILDFLKREERVKLSQIAVIYDDINDLSMVQKAGLKILVKQPGSNIFYKILEKQKMFNYLTEECGGKGAVREICELILSSLGIFQKCIEHRVEFSEIYQKYWRSRNMITPVIFVQKENNWQQLK